eukprot:2978484-Amphidinium_carterae.1
MAARNTECCLEAPQTWNDQCLAQIALEGGKIIDCGGFGTAHRRGLFGGINLQIQDVRAQLPQVWQQPDTTAQEAA